MQQKKTPGATCRLYVSPESTNGKTTKCLYFNRPLHVVKDILHRRHTKDPKTSEGALSRQQQVHP